MAEGVGAGVIVLPEGRAWPLGGLGRGGVLVVCLCDVFFLFLELLCCCRLRPSELWKGISVVGVSVIVGSSLI